MLARLFVFFGGFLVVALCSLLLAPFFVDWAGYRAAFEREASRIIGQPVRVEGTAKARILPFPSVTFSNIVIEGADGIPAARIGAFSMDAELAPFLSGEVLIFDMRIERPDVRIKLAENGALLWALPQSEALQGKTIALESVKVSEGRITVEKPGSDPVVFGNVGGTISAQSLSGPWVVDGRFMHSDTTYDARLSTGAKVANETLRLRLALAPQNGFYDAAFDGQIGVENEAPVYTGKLNLSVLGNGQAANGQRQKIGDVKSDFSIDINGVKVTEAAFVAGPTETPYRAEGSASLGFGKDARFEIKLKGQQISFEDIEGNTKTDRVTLGVPLAERLAALENVLKQIPVPEMPGHVDLALPTLVIGDTIIRNTEVKAAPAKDGWQIERYSVELPGRTIVEGAGALTLAQGLAFGGQMTLASKQPTGFVNWLGFKANNAIRALPGAGLTARINIDAKRQIFRDIEFRAGSAVLRGLIDRQVPQGARTQVSVQLSGENADFDVLQGLAAGNVQLSHEQDFDVALSSAPVSAFGFQAEKMETVLRLVGGELRVDQLEITGLNGADIGLSGIISNSFASPKGALNITIAALDPAAFMDGLTSRFPDQLWLKDATKRIGLMGTALADAKLTAAIKLGGREKRPELHGDFEYGFEAAELNFGGTGQIDDRDIKVTATGNANIGDTLLAGMGIPVGGGVTALQFLEPIAFEIAVESRKNEALTGTLKAASNLDFLETSFGTGQQLFTLRLADAAPYAMSAGYGLPEAAFGLPLNLQGVWEKTGTTLKLQKLQGTLVDVPVSGDLDFFQIEPLKITGNLKAASLNRSAVDEIMFGPVSAGGDDQAEFSGSFNLPFEADIALAIDQATGFTPLPLNQVTTRVVALKDTLRFADLKAELAGGKMTGLAEARKNGPDSLLNFNGTVTGADLSQLFTTGVSGHCDMQIELSAAGSTMDSLKASIVGSGVVSVNNAVLDGVGTTGFKGLVEEADIRELAPDATATLEMVARMIMSGQTVLPEIRAAFTVTSSAARAPKSFLNVKGGLLAFEPKIDLISGDTEIAASLLFDAGTEAPAGTEPALNFLLKGNWNDLSLAIDTTPLQGFLGQRALEREEVRVEAIQSAMLEKQRLRRENRYYAGLIEARAKAEADRLAETKRLEVEAANAELERIERARLEQERLTAEKANTTSSGAADSPADTLTEMPVDQPLNLDGLIRELEAKPAVQP